MRERLDPLTGELVAEKDRFFDPWRVPHSPPARELVQGVLDEVQAYEAAQGLRKRARRQIDQRSFEATVTAIVCDLVHALASGDEEVVVPRSNRVLGRKSRYRPAALGKVLPDVLDLLSAPEVGLIEQSLGYQNPFGENRRTAIQPGPKLLARMAQHRLEASDFTRDAHQEVLVLREPKRHEKHRPDVLEYTDTDETIRMRTNLRRINERIEAASIDILPGFAPAALPDQRRLRRVFTYGSFESGGRLFGGFWQEMSKADRQAGLQIEGRSTVELDYGQMAPRLLYAHAGVLMTMEDAYLIAGHATPELFREGFKKLFNALLFADRPLTRKPLGTKNLLPNASMGELVASLEDAHRPIAHFFHQGIGHFLQYLESELMVEVLLLAGETDITALPIHDAIIVARGREVEAMEIMDDVFRRRTGHGAVISVTAGDQ